MKLFLSTEQEDQVAFSKGQDFYDRIGLQDLYDLDDPSSEKIELLMITFNRYVTYSLKNGSYSTNTIDSLLNFPIYLQAIRLFSEALLAFELLHKMTVFKEKLFLDKLAIEIFKLELNVDIFEAKPIEGQPPQQGSESVNLEIKSELKKIIQSISELKIDSEKNGDRYKRVFEAIASLHGRIKNLSQYSAESLQLSQFLALQYNHSFFNDILRHQRTIQEILEKSHETKLNFQEDIESIKKEVANILTKVSSILSKAFENIKVADLEMLYEETSCTINLMSQYDEGKLIEAANSLVTAIGSIMIKFGGNIFNTLLIAKSINDLKKPMTEDIFRILSDLNQLFRQESNLHRVTLSNLLKKTAIGLSNSQNYKPELLMMRSFKIGNLDQKKDMLIDKSKEGQWPLVKQLISIYCTRSGIKTLINLLRSLGEMGWVQFLVQNQQHDLMKLLAALNISTVENKSIPESICKIYISEKKQTKDSLNQIVETLFNSASNLGPFLGNVCSFSEKSVYINSQRLPEALVKHIGYFLYFQYSKALFDYVIDSHTQHHRKMTQPNPHLLGFATFCVKLFRENYNAPISETCSVELTSWLMAGLSAPEHKIGRTFVLDKALRMHIAASIINLAEKNIYLLPKHIKNVIARSLKRVGSLRVEIHAAISVLLTDKIHFLNGSFLPLIGELSRLIDSLTLVWMIHFPKLAVKTVESQRAQLTKLVAEFLLSSPPCKASDDVKASDQSLVWCSPVGFSEYGVFESKRPVSKPDLAAVSFTCLQKIEVTTQTLNSAECRLLSLKKKDIIDRPLTPAEQKLLSFKSKRAFIRNGEKLFCIDSSACRVISTSQMMSWFKRLESPSSSSFLDASSKRKRQGS